VSQEKIDELSQQEAELSRLKAAFLSSIQDSVVIAAVWWLDECQLKSHLLTSYPCVLLYDVAHL